MNLTATGCGEKPRDRSGQYVLVSNIFGIITGVFIIQRFGYKLWAKLDFGCDDWFTLATALSGVPSTVINAHGVSKHGLGKDIWTLPFSDITKFTKYFYILEIIYFGEVAMVKLALLFFYMRIFPSGTIRKLLWGTVATVVLFGVTYVVVAIFQCKPVSYYWKMWDKEHEGTCVNINAVAWSNAAISIALDAWMLALPLWQLRTLNLDWRKKIGVGMMFCVGTFVTIVSILRLRSLISFGVDAINPTWDFYEVGIWSTVEINVGIICVCMPTLRLLLVRLFPRLLGTTQKYYARYGSQSNRTMSRKRQSRPMGNSNAIVSQLDRTESMPQVQRNQIACHKSYTVEYMDNDNDEAQLVYMRDLDRKSARSDLSSTV